MRARHPALLAVALLGLTGSARAAGPTDVSASSSLGTTTGVDRFQRQPYWELGARRLFVAGTVDAGYLYYRPQLTLGYGRPHWAWLGLDVYPSLSASSMTESVSAHAALPFLDVRVGARYVLAYDRRFLRPQHSYLPDDIETRQGPHARYFSLDAELSGAFQTHFGNVFGVVSGSMITGVPKGYYVFDESLHAVVAPPFVLRGRAGYVIKLGTDGEISLGIFGEVIDIPAREQGIFRAGPIAGLQISDHLDLLATFAFVLASDDALGLASGDIGQLGIRYRWATQEPAPVPLY